MEKGIFWKDKKTDQIVGLMVAVPLTLLFGYLFFLMVRGLIIEPSFFFNLSLGAKIVGFIFFIIAPLFFFYMLFFFLRRKRTYITKDGIFIGNKTFRSEWTLTPRQKPTFFDWKNVKNMKIVIKTMTTPVGSFKGEYLILTAKNGRDYECRIVDYSGFKKAIEKSGKSTLLTHIESD